MKSIGVAHVAVALCTVSLCAGLFGRVGLAAAQASAYGGPPAARAGYVGSAECAGCHTHIFERWKQTRHAYSVLDANEARAAGYPPPPLPHGTASGVTNGWSEVSYVVGGRQRIAYVTRGGEVLDSAYHHRLAKWSVFPTKPWAACGACHATGVGAVPQRADDGSLPFDATERNIGCEACHGPGAAHVESLEPEDILVDASSRSCGSCHTAAGKVLPKDDLHDTHDLVQTWNRDRHVLGVRFQSHNAFCSDCHSPYERGAFTERSDGAAKRVFTEHKQNVTCIGCHDPHATTNARYRRDQVHLGPPAAPPPHVYRGNDDDFTTTDFDALPSTEAVCLDCHRGADRIDLDHANATCNDCHNTFNRNRMPESRAFRDANHRRLSCRPCHADADHLISIVHEDGGFLEPRHVHDLRALPQAVVERYGFAYPSLRSSRRAALPADPGGLRVAPAMSVAVLLARRSATPSDPTPLSELLALARAYSERGEHEATRDALERTAESGSRAYRTLLFAAGSSRPAVQSEDPDPGASTAGSGPVGPASAVAAPWLEGLLDLAEGRFTDAARVLEQAQRLEPANAHVGLHLGLAKLGERRPANAVATLEGVTHAHPSHSAARIALAAIYINGDRLERAREHLEEVTALDPENAVAAYFLGRTHLRSRHPVEAAAAFRTAIVSDPTDLNSWFHLARAYRAGRYYGAAIETYDEIIRREPAVVDAHYDQALLYKLLSDKVATTHKRRSESARPEGVGTLEWRRYLTQLERRVVEYADHSLAAFDRAALLRPLEADGILQVAEIFRRAGRYTEAREQFERLVRAEPTSFLHRYRLGTIALILGEHVAAVAHLEDALRLAPVEGDVYVALALAYALSGRNDDAVATLEQGGVYEPFNPALYTNLGAAYAVRGDDERAREALERALRLRTFPLPRTHLAHTNLAVVQWRQGRRADAVRSLERALHVFPDYPYAARLLELAKSADGVATDGLVPVYNDLLERFGEVSTVAFAGE